MKRNPVGLLAVAILSLAAAQASAQGGLTRIADNVYAYVGARNASPSTSFGANAGIVIGNDGIAVIDTLISAKEADRFIKDIRAVSQKPIKYVIDTHEHLDHVFGNAEFARLGATIVSQANCRKNMIASAQAVLRSAKDYGLSEDDMKGTQIAIPTVAFRGTVEIDLGGRTVELIDPGPSHTNGSILVYVPDTKTLFAGDVLFTDYHPYIGDGSIDAWTGVLDRILGMDVEAIVPGHGPLSGKKDVTDMKNYLVAFDAKAKELCAKSGDAAAIKSELMKALPERAEGSGLIDANLQMKYLKK